MLGHRAAEVIPVKKIRQRTFRRSRAAPVQTKRKQQANGPRNPGLDSAKVKDVTGDGPLRSETFIYIYHISRSYLAWTLYRQVIQVSRRRRSRSFSKAQRWAMRSRKSSSGGWPWKDLLGVKGMAMAKRVQMIPKNPKISQNIPR